jgi:hypothetical protein
MAAVLADIVTSDVVLANSALDAAFGRPTKRDPASISTCGFTKSDLAHDHLCHN